jgi:hypothetical protein
VSLTSRQEIYMGCLYFEGTKLGVAVKPEDVRLITSIDDPYAWQIVPGKEHLFKKEILKKHISKHSIGAYRHLYRAIGNSLEATLPAETHGFGTDVTEDRVSIFNYLVKMTLLMIKEQLSRP